MKEKHCALAAFGGRHEDSSPPIKGLKAIEVLGYQNIIMKGKSDGEKIIA